MHDAGLYHTIRKHRRDGLRKTLQPVHDGDQQILGAADLELVHHAEPELRPPAYSPRNYDGANLGEFIEQCDGFEVRRRGTVMEVRRRPDR